MRLIKFSIKNYRCHLNLNEFFVDDLTGIIGKNDIGKSAILDAMEAFFNGVIDSSDLSQNADSNEVELTAYFEGIPDKIILDTSVESSPKGEGLLNSEGQLVVKRVFSFGNRLSKSTYLIAWHPLDERLEKILCLKKEPLKSLADQLEVNTKGIRTKNSLMREAIRNHIGGDWGECELKVDGGLNSEDNLKSIWKNISALLPVYSLFKSDKTFDDKDGDIKDPMQVAINEALALDEIKQLLDEVELKVKEISTNVADRTIQKLKDFDETISEKLRSEFGKTPTYNKVFDLTLLNDKDIPLNKRGSGIRRLVVLSFFRAQAEKRMLESGAPSVIYAIEEPETSQHPNHQKMIIETLHELSEQDHTQVLFTTHSANLVGEIAKESLRFVSENENEDESIFVEYCIDRNNSSENEEVLEKIINALGVLPNPKDKVKVLVYLEGNNDVLALKRYNKLISDQNDRIINICNTEQVAFVITGGSSLKHYVDKKYLDGLGKPQVHIYDSDVPNYVDIVGEINQENDPCKYGFNTSKREIENYLHPEAIDRAYQRSGMRGVLLPNISDADDIPQEVAKLINSLGTNDWDTLSEERKKRLSDRKKKILNTVAIEDMSVELLKERSGYDEMCEWFDKIAEFASL